MKTIYMQSTIDNFIAKGRIKEIEAVEGLELVEDKDEKGNVLRRYFKVEP